MDKEISVITISQLAWKIFLEKKLSWIFLAVISTIFMVLGVAIHLYIPEYIEETAILLSLLGALYTAILHQNGLDAVYGRKLSMMHISSSVVFASLFFVAISLYSPFPQYLELLLLVLPEDFYFLVALNWLVHGIVSYLLMRFMFVGMILLEEKSSVKDAVIESFAMTQNHVLLLLMTFIYLVVILALSVFTILGYFVALPYTILMRALLFKQLRANLKL